MGKHEYASCGPKPFLKNLPFSSLFSSYPYAFRRAVSVFGMKNLSEIAKEAAIARLAMGWTKVTAGTIISRGVTR